MRVGVDMSILRHPFTGSARWANGLVDSLRLEQYVQLTEWMGPRRLVRGGAARKVLNLLRERAWYDIGLPRAASRARSDVLLMPANLTSGRTSVPQVVTILDVNFLTQPGTYDRGYARYAEGEFRRSARRAARVTTLSLHSRSEIGRHLDIDPTHIDVVHPGLTPPPPIPLPPRPLESAYALYVGATEPHKDVPTAIRAWRHLHDTPLSLAIVGQPGRDHERVKAMAQESGRRVIVVGRVTDAELEAWYRNAALFIFPSLTEGFGYPPLEAMLRGVPVVAARAASLPEVLGDAALYFEVGQDEELAGAVRRILDDGGLRGRLVEAGRTRGAAFTWQRAARAMLQILREAAGAVHGGPGEQDTIGGE
jgi:glycosyltransferase involved in cell wall biosynthesis